MSETKVDHRPYGGEIALPLDYDATLDAIAADIAEQYGLDTDTARVGTEWARDWLYGISALNPEEITREIILNIRDMTLDGLPVPRDATENRPTFRVRYAAQQALYIAAGEQGEMLREILEGASPRIIPDFGQIDHVLTTLLDAYRQPAYPYSLDSTRVPQDPRHMPRNLELDPANRTHEQAIQLASFWFTACYYMRGVNDSNDMTINLAALHEDHPEIFDFATAATMEPAVIERLLLDYHLAVQHKQTSEHWVENAKRMTERHGGDPLRVFEDVDTYDELVARIRNDGKGDGFKGFQKKMTSMLSYFYMVSDLIPYKNHPLPVDFHVIRLSVSQQLVRFEYLPESGQIPFNTTTDFLREVFYNFADHHNISQLELCDVVWLFSRELCSHSPGNTLRQIGKYAARSTALEPTLTGASTATPKQIEQYSRSCGMCIVADSCVHNVPSARYYKHGIVVLPDPKIHLENKCADIHSADVIAQAQRPVKPAPLDHAIDTRARLRELSARQRARIIRQLAQSPLDGLDEHATTTPQSFTRKEILSALGNNAHPDDIARVYKQVTVHER